MAKLRVDFHPAAQQELEAAFERYCERSTKAAEALLLEIESARRAIQNSPENWARYSHDTRRYLLDRFPFAVVYRVASNRIEIVAIAHGHRKPGYWADRIE